MADIADHPPLRPVANLRAGGLHLAAALVLLLALTHAALFALASPPWGLNDEQQHLDYALRLAHGEGPPVFGQDLLRDDVAQAVYDADRWARFGWPAPPSSDPAGWGLEGLSYEAHQPPLYYGLLALDLAAVGAGDPAGALIYARLATALLSLATLGFLFGTLRLLWPARPELALAGCLVLALQPGRIIAVSQVSNDALAEVVGAAFLYLATRAALRGVTVPRAAGLGLLLAAGLLTKLTTAGLGLLGLVLCLGFAGNRRGALGAAAAFSAVAALGLAAFAWHVAGNAGAAEISARWDEMRNFSPLGTSPADLARAALSLATSYLVAERFMDAWLGGGRVALAAGSAAVLALAAMPGLALVRQDRTAATGPGDARGRRWIVALSATCATVVVLLFLLAIAGYVPQPVGRLLLPYDTALTVLAVAVFARARHGGRLLTLFAAVLGALSLAWLARETSVLYRPLPALEGLTFLDRVGLAKPGWVGAALPPLLALHLCLLAAAALVSLRARPGAIAAIAARPPG